MSISKFQELVELRKSDYQQTYEYTDKNFEFIKILVSQLGEYLGCSSSNIMFTDSSLKERASIMTFFHNLIIVDDECFFNFKLLIQLHDSTEAFHGFNINNCGKSFAEKHLIPPSGIILPIAIKQENNSFTLKVFDRNEKGAIYKHFSIKLEEDEPFVEVFNFLFQAIKKQLELGLEGRINMLNQQETISETSFGFISDQQQ